MDAKLTAMYVVAGAELKPNAFGGDVSADQRADIAQKNADDAFKKVKSDCAKADVPLEILAVKGNPAQELIKASENYDLVVCGILGLTGLSKVLMGSVSDELVRKAKCPVLVCRKK